MPSAERKSSPEAMAFLAFDLLHLDGEDLRSLPLVETQGEPEAAGRACSHPVLRAVEADGREFLAAVDGMGLVGMVSKRASSLSSMGLEDRSSLSKLRS